MDCKKPFQRIHLLVIFANIFLTPFFILAFFIDSFWLLFFTLTLSLNINIAYFISNFSTKQGKIPPPKNKENNYLRALDSSGVYAKLDAKQNIKYANRQFCQLLHMTKEECNFKAFETVMQDSIEEVYKTLHCGQSWEGLQKFYTADGQTLYLNCSFIPIFDAQEQLQEVLFLATDSTDLIKSKTNIQKNLYLDTLTKLPNRLHLFTDKKMLSQNSSALYILFNIDAFDAINNLYGHHCGDDIIKQTAKWLQEHLPTKNTILYKLEADNYLAIHHEQINEGQLNQYLQSISKKISAQKFFYEGAQIDITMTIGAAQGKNNLLKLSQIAFKEAKRQRRSFSIYDKGSNKEELYKQNVQMSKILKDAVNEGLLRTYFQPIMEIKSQKIHKHETLMRIEKKDKQILCPNEFLPIAKQSKTYSLLSQSLIKKSIDTFLHFSQEFSINLSFLDITNKQTTKMILQELQNTDIGPWIVFELLESEGLENYDEVFHFIEQVKSYGAKIAIDDFGSGYSNFEHLLQLNVDYIKIDGSLIKNIDKNEDAYVITKTIVSFAKELGIKTIAEFVHSKEVLQTVTKLDIDFAQGYYIGKPTPNLQNKPEFLL